MAAVIIDLASHRRRRAAVARLREALDSGGLRVALRPPGSEVELLFIPVEGGRFVSENGGYTVTSDGVWLRTGGR